MLATLAFLLGPDVRKVRPWSVQLHLHGPFSEGEGSVASHSYQARDVGCDVLWWSEHDFRLTTYRHVTRFGFEGPREPLARGEPWVPWLKHEVSGWKLLEPAALPLDSRTSFVSSPVKEGDRSLKLEAPGSREGVTRMLVTLTADRFLVRRSLATGVTLRLAILPEVIGRDDSILVDCRLSEHPSTRGDRIEPRFVRYVLGDSGIPRQEGNVYVVPVPLRRGDWNEIVLPLSEDAARGHGFGVDASLYALSFGLQTAQNGGTVAYLDDLRIEQAHAGPDMLARQAELLSRVEADTPGPVQLQGTEVSYLGRHFNVFTDDLFLPNYDRIIAEARAAGRLGDRSAAAEFTRRLISEVHRRGGLVSYNHPFGTSFDEEGAGLAPESVLQDLLDDAADGADILEVGYRQRGGATLEDHLRLWDQAGLHGVPLIGVGVSDSHGGDEHRWRGSPNNFVSWIWAARATRAELLEGLRAGRVFFGDIECFDGELDLSLETGERMGATLSTSAESVRVRMEVRGLEEGQRIVAVDSGVRTACHLPSNGEFIGEHLHVLSPTASWSLFRIEIHDDSGPIAISNPIRFRRP